MSKNLPVCSVIRPTETKGVATGVVKFLTDMGLFIGQSKEFFAFLADLAEDADEARRGQADRQSHLTVVASRHPATR